MSGRNDDAPADAQGGTNPTAPAGDVATSGRGKPGVHPRSRGGRQARAGENRSGAVAAPATPASGQAGMLPSVRNATHASRPNTAPGSSDSIREKTTKASARKQQVEEEGVTHQVALKVDLAYSLSLFSFMPYSVPLVHQIGVWLFGVYVRHKESQSSTSDPSYQPSRCPEIEACCPPFDVPLSLPGTGAKVTLLHDADFTAYIDSLVPHLVNFQKSVKKRLNFSSIPAMIYSLCANVRRYLTDPPNKVTQWLSNDKKQELTWEDMRQEDGEVAQLSRILFLMIPQCFVLTVSETTGNHVPTRLSFNPFYGNEAGAELFAECGPHRLPGSHAFILSAAFEGTVLCAHEIARRFPPEQDHRALSTLMKCREYCQPPYGTDCSPLESHGTILQQLGSTQLLFFPGKTVYQFPSKINPISIFNYKYLYEAFRKDQFRNATIIEKDKTFQSSETWGATERVKNVRTEYTVHYNTLPLFTSIPITTKIEAPPEVVNSAFIAFFDEFSRVGSNQHAFAIKYDVEGRDFQGAHGISALDEAMYFDDED